MRCSSCWLPSLGCSSRSRGGRGSSFHPPSRSPPPWRGSTDWQGSRGWQGSKASLDSQDFKASRGWKVWKRSTRRTGGTQASSRMSKTRPTRCGVRPAARSTAVITRAPPTCSRTSRGATRTLPARGTPNTGGRSRFTKRTTRATCGSRAPSSPRRRAATPTPPPSGKQRRCSPESRPRSPSRATRRPPAGSPARPSRAGRAAAGGKPPARNPPTGEPSGVTPGGGGGCPRADDDDDLRIAALNGLLQMDAANAVPILRKVLARRDACSVELRRKAVFLVSQKRTAETEDILLDIAQRDPDSEVRQKAVFWLSQVPTERAVGMLDSILRTTHDDELRDKAIFALSQQHGPRAAQALHAYAERTDAPVESRGKAIFWLGQQHSTENSEYLRGLYAKLTDQDLKEKVIFSLSQMGGAENMRWMMDIALNEREPIEQRKKALFWAGQGGAALDQLAALYDRIQSSEMKEQLIFVYSQRHESQALEALIRIARTEKDKDLRKKAIFWLGQSHDPRAAQVCWRS